MRAWRNFEAVAFALLDGADRFDERRLLESIGDIPPEEADRRRWDERAQQAANAADSKRRASDHPGWFIRRPASRRGRTRHPSAPTSCQSSAFPVADQRMR
jgi:hypothetical protein